MGELKRHPRGYPVQFNNPTTNVRETGSIIDEIWTPEPESFGEIAKDPGKGWLESAVVAQLIEWTPGDRAIRLAYYTRRPGKGHKNWVFAQYASAMGLEDCGKIIRSIEERGWLQGLPV